jgi:uncharacterized protein YpuA (DUF1002 family)
MHCHCFKIIIDAPESIDTELTDVEKNYAMMMCGLTDTNVPFNEDFFNNMNKKQVDFLMSKVDRQNCQYSPSYARYVNKLTKLSDSMNS